MSDDVLFTVWMSDRPVSKESVITAVKSVLDEDRAIRDRERGIRAVCLLALLLLCPALLWCAAYGKTPLVRGGYALMAVGTAVMVFAEWAYLAWCRQALPGPADARSHLQRTALLLAHQATLLRTAALWCAPIFIGTAFIGTWLYQERSHAAGALLWAAIAGAWLTIAMTGLSKGAVLDERRSRVERVLSDLG